MANINHQWKRGLIVGCSHGHYIDWKAANEVLAFRERWKPHLVGHTGDWADTAPFRAGAKGGKDEAVDLESDLGQGVRFLKLLKPDFLLNGNHDIRIWKGAEHYNAIIRECSRQIIADVRRALPKKCHFVEGYRILHDHYQLSDLRLMHGFMVGENALRDHAERFGKCMIAHLHTPGNVRGRRLDQPEAWCIGYLGNGDLFTYADTWPSKMRWEQGVGIVYYTDKWTECQVIKRGKAGWVWPA